jgi:hypothetical protein
MRFTRSKTTGLARPSIVDQLFEMVLPRWWTPDEEHDLGRGRHGVDPLHVERRLGVPARAVGVVDGPGRAQDLEVDRRQPVDPGERLGVLRDCRRAERVGDDHGLARAVEAGGVERLHVVGRLHLVR